MRTRTQKLLIIAMACVLGGGVLAAAAWGLGAQTSISLPGTRALERLDLNEILTAFDRLDARVDVANLTLREGTEFAVSGHFYGDISIEVRGSTLFLVADTPWQRNIHIGFSTRSQGGDIIITVPALTELDASSLTLGVGNIQVQNVTLHNARITSGVGNVDVSALLTGRTDVESGVGDIRLRLPDNPERVSYSGTVGLGNLTIDGSNMASGGVGVVGATASHTAADPIGEIYFSSGVGSVRIDFRA